MRWTRARRALCAWVTRLASTRKPIHPSTVLPITADDISGVLRTGELRDLRIGIDADEVERLLGPEPLTRRKRVTPLSYDGGFLQLGMKNGSLVFFGIYFRYPAPPEYAIGGLDGVASRATTSADLEALLDRLGVSGWERLSSTENAWLYRWTVAEGARVCAVLDGEDRLDSIQVAG